MTRINEEWEKNLADVLGKIAYAKWNPRDGGMAISERAEVRRHAKWASEKGTPTVPCPRLFLCAKRVATLEGIYTQALIKFLEWSKGMPGGKTYRIPVGVTSSGFGDLAVLSVEALVQLLKDLSEAEMDLAKAEKNIERLEGLYYGE